MDHIGEILKENPYMDRGLWKKVHVWTVSPYVSGRKSIYRCTLGVWACTLGVWTYTAGSGCLNLYFGCLNLYIRCLNLHRCTWGVWTYTLGVWTYTLSVWTYTAVLWVSERILWFIRNGQGHSWGEAAKQILFCGPGKSHQAISWPDQSRACFEFP